MSAAVAVDPGEPILCAVINWNGWRDTIVCLQSLFEIQYPAFELVICDNGSDNGSCQHLAAWLKSQAQGREARRSDLDGGAYVLRFDGTFGAAVGSVHLLRLPHNFGYAGAINRCIAWGQDAISARSFWLLNNDVRTDPQALAALAAAAASSPDIGLVGSVLTDWDRPERIQAVAGSYRRWPAVGAHTTRLPANDAPPVLVLGASGYPVGASLFVTDRFLRSVGTMEESYFLYYEEMDWAERGRRLGFRPAVALNSRVQHKEGASTGSQGGVRNKSMLSEYYGVINRLRFTRKFFPVLVPAVWLSLILVVLDRVLHGEWRRAGLVLRLMLAPGSVPRP